MQFSKLKESFLNKPDKSRKGSIDKPIKDLVEEINALPSYFTLSSCSGRITLIESPDMKRKDKTTWLLSSHAPVTIDQVMDALEKKGTDTVWLKQDPMIVHIRCKEMKDAQDLITKANAAGFRRCGLISAKEKLVVEIVGTQTISLPLGDERVLLSKEQLDYLIGKANMQLKENFLRIKRLKEKIKTD